MRTAVASLVAVAIVVGGVGLAAAQRGKSDGQSPARPAKADSQDSAGFRGECLMDTLGMEVGPRAGMGFGRGPGMGPGRGQGLGKGRGQAMGRGQSQGGGCGQSDAMGRGRGQGMGCGQAMGRGMGQGRGNCGQGRRIEQPDPGFGRGRQRGRGMGADIEFQKDRDLFHFLLTHRESIDRKVKKRDDGIETLTESNDPDVARAIQEHVASMDSRVEAGRPIHLRDPLFAAIFANANKISMNVERTKKGVRVVETSTDPHVAKLIQAHADVLNLFIANGHAEVQRNHAVPRPNR